MKRKQIGIMTISLIVIGLMISVSGSPVFQNQGEQEQTLIVKKQVHTPAQMDLTYSETLELVTKTKPTGTLDIPSFYGIEPAVSHSGSAICGGSLELEQENVFYYGSIDGGQTWLGGLGWVMDDVPEKPSIDGCGDGRFIASLVPGPYDRDGSVMMKTTIGDVSDFENSIGGRSWDWYDVGAGYYNFVDVEVAGYTASDPAENEWSYGSFAIVGDHGELGGNTGFFAYENSDSGMAWIYTLSDTPGAFNGVTSCGIDIDHSNNFGYAVYNYDNAGTKDLYIFMMNHDEWGDFEGYPIHDDTYETYIQSSGNDNVVDISALSDNVIIVSERDGAIVAYYSSDGLDTVNEVIIDGDGNEPRIVHYDTNRAACSFIREGTFYTCVTEDGGETWTPANDNSENEPVESGDICAFGGVYTTEETVYFAPIDTSMPIIEVDAISGGIGVTVDISNTGTGDGVDIPYSITATGGLLGMINKNSEGTITINAGGSQSISLPMILGIGSVTIEISVGSISQTVTGTQLLVYTNI